jgi:ElaB/YqjD/DUF883 family membrane-anchored ribosome-binding protein
MLTTQTRPSLSEAMSSATVSDNVTALKDDLQRLRGDVGTLTSSLKEMGKETATAAGRSLQSTATELQEGVQQRLDSGLAFARKSARERPLTTAAVVFGAGFLLGKLLQKR